MPRSPRWTASSNGRSRTPSRACRCWTAAVVSPSASESLQVQWRGRSKRYSEGLHDMAMTRRRYITPEAFTTEDLMSLPPAVRLLEAGLRLYADDHGRERVNQLLIRAAIFPLNPEITEVTIDEYLLQLDEAGCLAIYEADGRTYFAFTDWPTVDRPARSSHPAPPSPSERASRSSRESFVAEERERERAGESDGEWGDESWREEAGDPARSDREGLPPSPFCRQHPGGTEGGKPCRGCGTARLRNQHWTATQQARARVEFEDRGRE